MAWDLKAPLQSPHSSGELSEPGQALGGPHSLQIIYAYFNYIDVLLTCDRVFRNKVLLEHKAVKHNLCQRRNQRPQEHGPRYSP